MKIAVIGGGWAGLSAAFYLNQAGHHVSVFEAAHTLGGRARRVHSPRLNMTIDNGQHILLGAYTATLKLIEDLGVPAKSVLHQQRLSLETLQGHFAIKAWPLPAPLHLLTAIVCARGLSLKERWRLITISRRLQQQQWTTVTDISVLQWLKEGKQSDHIIRYFWQPLCLAALNTPIACASAQLFANVLRDSIGADQAASAVLIPRVDLSSLWPERLPRDINIHHGQAIRHISYQGNAPIELNSQQFEAVVIATNAPSASRLLKSLPPSAAGDAYLAKLAAFDYIPIATLTLKLAHAWQLPNAMLMLNDKPNKRQFGQWLFDRSLFMSPITPDERTTINIVISDARMLVRHSNDDIVAGVIKQIQEQTQRFTTMPNVLGYELIVEKRATFAAVPGLQRPTNSTPWPRVWVAGDWTDTNYPAVLEGAVRSGKRAAMLIN